MRANTVVQNTFILSEEDEENRQRKYEDVQLHYEIVSAKSMNGSMEMKTLFFMLLPRNFHCVQLF